MTPYAEARAAIDEMRDALADRLCEFCGPAGIDPAVLFSAVGELFFNAGIQTIGPEIFRDALLHMLAQLGEIAPPGATTRHRVAWVGDKGARARTRVRDYAMRT